MDNTKKQVIPVNERKHSNKKITSHTPGSTTKHKKTDDNTTVPDNDACETFFDTNITVNLLNNISGIEREDHECLTNGIVDMLMWKICSTSRMNPNLLYRLGNHIPNCKYLPLLPRIDRVSKLCKALYSQQEYLVDVSNKTRDTLLNLSYQKLLTSISEITNGDRCKFAKNLRSCNSGRRNTNAKTDKLLSQYRKYLYIWSVCKILVKIVELDIFLVKLLLDFSNTLKDNLNQLSTVATTIIINSDNSLSEKTNDTPLTNVTIPDKGLLRNCVEMILLQELYDSSSKSSLFYNVHDLDLKDVKGLDNILENFYKQLPDFMYEHSRYKDSDHVSTPAGQNDTRNKFNNNIDNLTIRSILVHFFEMSYDNTSCWSRTFQRYYVSSPLFHFLLECIPSPEICNGSSLNPLNDRIDYYVAKLSDVLYLETKNVTKETLDEILCPYNSFFDTDILCLDNYAFLKVLMNDNQKRFDIIRSNLPGVYSEDLSTIKSVIPDNLLKISIKQVESIIKYGSIFNSIIKIPRLPNRSLCTNYGKQFRNTISTLFFKFDFLSSYAKFNNLSTSNNTTATTTTTTTTSTDTFNTTATTSDITSTITTTTNPPTDIGHVKISTNSQVIIIDEEETQAAESLISMTNLNNIHVPGESMSDTTATISKPSLCKRTVFKYHNTKFHPVSGNARPTRAGKFQKTSDNPVSVKNYEKFTDQTPNIVRVSSIVNTSFTNSKVDTKHTNTSDTTGIKTILNGNYKQTRNTIDFSSIFLDSPAVVNGNS